METGTETINKDEIVYKTYFEEEFWPNYPSRNGKKLGKGQTFQALKRHVKIVELDDLKIALQNYVKSEDVRRGCAKDPAIFFKNKKWSWKDWLESTEPSPELESYKRRNE
jgi:hypothetical protein